MEAVLFGVLKRLLIALPFIAAMLVAEAVRRRRAPGPASLPVNVGLTVLSEVVAVAVGVPLVTAVLGALSTLPGYGFAALPTPRSALELAAFAATWMLATDGLYYAFHRAQHTVPWLWRLHAVHHSDESAHVTTAQRTHPSEPVLRAVCLSLPTLYAFGPSPGLAATVTLVSIAWTHLVHADIPVSLGRWSWLVVTPLGHRLHHSAVLEHRDRNFAGLFPVWDVLGGTYMRPTHEPFETGLGAALSPRTAERSAVLASLRP